MGGGRQPFGADYGKLMMWFFLLSDALTFSGFLCAMGLYRFKYEDTWPVAENVFTHFPFVEGNQPLLYVALMTFILIMSSVTMVLAVKGGHELKRNKVILWLGLTIVGGLIFLGSQAWEWYRFIVGDNGAVQLQNQTVVHVVDAEGEVMSLNELIMGEPAGHGSHAQFSSEAMRTAFAANKNLSLKYPGKAEEVMARAKAESLMKNAQAVQGANMTRNEYGNVLFGNFFFFVTGFHGFHVFSGVIINLIIFINVIMGTYERRGHYEMVEKVGLYWHFVDLVWVFVFTFFYLV
ncbi:MAG: cytochrome c oxidase subunit 3 [Owenweeksia sp.]|nr:cytochrome c oxidase subunit 3 [Owenweeksia sp.]